MKFSYEHQKSLKYCNVIKYITAAQSRRLRRKKRGLLFESSLEYEKLVKEQLPLSRREERRIESFFVV